MAFLLVAILPVIAAGSCLPFCLRGRPTARIARQLIRLIFPELPVPQPVFLSRPGVRTSLTLRPALALAAAVTRLSITCTAFIRMLRRHRRSHRLFLHEPSTICRALEHHSDNSSATAKVPGWSDASTVDLRQFNSSVRGHGFGNAVCCRRLVK
jgi:hypothetical protein